MFDNIPYGSWVGLCIVGTFVVCFLAWRGIVLREEADKYKEADEDRGRQLDLSRELTATVDRILVKANETNRKLSLTVVSFLANSYDVWKRYIRFAVCVKEGCGPFEQSDSRDGPWTPCPLVEENAPAGMQEPSPEPSHVKIDMDDVESEGRRLYQAALDDVEKHGDAWHEWQLRNMKTPPKKPTFFD